MTKGVTIVNPLNADVHEMEQIGTELATRPICTIAIASATGLVFSAIGVTLNIAALALAATISSLMISIIQDDPMKKKSMETRTELEITRAIMGLSISIVSQGLYDERLDIGILLLTSLVTYVATRIAYAAAVILFLNAPELA